MVRRNSPLSVCMAVQGRPLKASDLIPLGPVPESSARQAGATLPQEWLPSFPADKATPWKVLINTRPRGDWRVS